MESTFHLRVLVPSECLLFLNFFFFLAVLFVRNLIDVQSLKLKWVDESGK